ncbi:MAG TPA: hypothetical protein VHL78_04200 [Actinomycetota bacterium]|nr:hypothetical protein [Actinomycetota bacterium]
MRTAARHALPLLAVALMATPAAAGPDRFVLEDALTSDGLDFTVTPSEHDLVLGHGNVAFRNDGDLPHTLVDRSGLFEWGPIAPEEGLVFDPWAAGRYRFDEAQEGLYTARSDTGRFSVKPAVGPGGDDWFGQRSVRVRWATRRAPEGLVYDVKYSRGGGWRWWKQGVRAPSKRFVVPNWDPAAMSSCLGFKARLRDPDDPDRKLGWAETGVRCIVVD